MWTTVPPAKSMTWPKTALTAPPALKRPPPQTMKASGQYTRVTQMGTKTAQAVNLARSAMAPLIRATVMMAKVARSRP